jgi:ABC-type sugar transport system ATPase subunit
MSKGMQQRLGIAQALVGEPRLLLLDEPTRGVDVAARMRITTALRRLSGEGVAIVCASGDHEELSRLCDRVLVFGAGRVASELAGEDVTETRIAERCQAAARPAGDPGP